MKGGFSFCGIDIADIGMEYAPELEDTYVYRPAESEVHEELFDCHHGGYSYGATVKPKEFTLRCFFENTIDRGLMARFYSLFKVGKSGKLIFSRMPWYYYYATVTELDDSGLMSYRSGTIEIKMKAYYPFGRSDIFFCSRTDKDYYRIIENTALLEKEEMVPQMEFEQIQSSGTPVSIVLANPGTERSPVCISIAGDIGDGIDITNVTTGQTCGVVGFSKAETTDVNKRVLIDSMNGKTVLSGNGTTKPAFLYHDKGYIELEPSFPAERQIYVITTQGNVITTSNMLNESMIGKFIYANGSWHKIAEITDVYHMKIEGSTETNGNIFKTMIMPLNEIVIQPSTSMDISLSFIYKPTFA